MIIDRYGINHTADWVNRQLDSFEQQSETLKRGMRRIAKETGVRELGSSLQAIDSMHVQWKALCNLYGEMKGIAGKNAASVMFADLNEQRNRLLELLDRSCAELDRHKDMLRERRVQVVGFLARAER